MIVALPGLFSYFFVSDLDIDKNTPDTLECKTQCTAIQQEII